MPYCHVSEPITANPSKRLKRLSKIMQQIAFKDSVKVGKIESVQSSEVRMIDIIVISELLHKPLELGKQDVHILHKRNDLPCVQFDSVFTDTIDNPEEAIRAATGPLNLCPMHFVLQLVSDLLHLFQEVTNAVSSNKQLDNVFPTINHPTLEYL